MWEWIVAFFSYSPLPFILAIVIALLSIGDVFSEKNKRVGKKLKITVVVLTIMLLIAQRASDNATSQEADSKLHTALTQQRNELTQAFTAGTNQVIKATSETATKTQRSAKDQTNAIEQQAKQQTEAIKKQAAEQYTQLQGAMMGASQCPEIMMGSQISGQKPNSIDVINEDTALNMYDVRIELTEMGPVDPNKLGSPWSSTLNYQVVLFPQIVPHWASSTPITIHSKMDHIWVSFRVTTRTTANCTGQMFLYDTGNNNWLIYASTMMEGTKPIVNYYQNVAPGLEKSKLDPDPK